MRPDKPPKASLTVALDDSGSATNAFFDEYLPHHHRLVGPWSNALRVLSGRQPPSDPRTAHLTGPAIELRIGYDLAERLPYLDLSTSVGPGPDASLFRTLSYVPPTKLPHAPPHQWRRIEDRVEALNEGNRSEQLRALHHCWRMAYIEDLRYALRRAGGTDEQTPWLWRIANDISISDDATNALIGLWRNYLLYGRSQMHRHSKHAITRPTFAGGFGVGDLLLGDTLVDVKLTHDPESGLARCVRQIVSYALADSDDEYGIASIGVYHAREAHLATWPLDRALKVIATSPMSITALRSRFAEVIVAERSEIKRRTGS